jgi:hypothetical protein
MEQRFTFTSSTSSSSSSSSCASYTPETKSDIIAFAIGNPANKLSAKLSENNQNLLGSDIADLFAKRHNHELQRCSQFYSLASIFNERTTKDKHRMNTKNFKKMYSTGRKYILRLFICF